MSYIGKNIKKIRTVKNLSQAAFAQLFNLARPSVGAYEEGRSEPKIDTLVQIAQHFGISVDLLLTKELTINELYGFDIFKKGLNRDHVLKKVATEGKEQVRHIPLITAEITERYLTKNLDKSFVAVLPTVSVPLQQTTAEARAFEISDEIFQTDKDQKKGNILLCTAVEKHEPSLQPEQIYVVVTSDKIYTGRLKSYKHKKLSLKTTPADATDLELSMDQVQELWEVKAKIMYLPTAPVTPDDRVAILESKVQNLLERVEKLENKDSH